LPTFANFLPKFENFASWFEKSRILLRKTSGLSGLRISRSEKQIIKVLTSIKGELILKMVKTIRKTSGLSGLRISQSENHKNQKKLLV